MIHAILFEDPQSGRTWNTRDDWGLALQTQPTFSMPPVKTKTLDVPGGNGIIDLTTAITGYPLYGNREGSFTLAAKARQAEWQTLLSELAGILHGQALRAILEDDAGWYYEGRFTLNIGECSLRHAIITIDYSVGPYAWSMTATDEPWKWDPFSFVDGVIGWGVYTDPVTGITYTGADAFGHIEVTTTPLALTFSAGYPDTGRWPLSAAGTAPQMVNIAATGGDVSLTVERGGAAIATATITDGATDYTIPGLVLYRGVWLYNGQPAEVSAAAEYGTATLGMRFRAGKL